MLEDGTVGGTLSVAGEIATSKGDWSNVDVLNFKLDERPAGSDALLVSDISVFSDTAAYTITVSDTQDWGTYYLAGGAADFSESVTLKNSAGDTLGIFTGGEYGSILADNGVTYTLECSNFGDLSLTLTSIPVVTMTPEGPTNENVLVTAVFSDDAALRLYRFIDDEEDTWREYEGTITVTENTTLYFQAVDSSGGCSEITSCTVDNIDREIPDRPSVEASETAPTNQNVILTVSYSPDSVLRQYSLNGTDWLDDDDGIHTVTENSVWYFRSADDAGNYSEIAQYEVGNIDKTPPEFAVLRQNCGGNEAVLSWIARDAGSSGLKNTFQIELDGVLYETGGPTYTVTGLAEDSAIHIWRVLAEDEAGNRTWSTLVGFHTANDCAVTRIDASEAGSQADRILLEIAGAGSGFANALRLLVSSDAAVDSLNIPGGIDWRFTDLSGNPLAGSGSAEQTDEAVPRLILAENPSGPAIFFVRPDGVWGYEHCARNARTGELAVLHGKNRFSDLFDGNGSRNILYLTDDSNGDALFLDDVFSDMPDGMDGCTQARLSSICEIRAGAGNDIIDLTNANVALGGEDGITIRGGDGSDVIWAVSGNSRLYGDSGNDRLTGSGGNDLIAGGSGDDVMHGGGGDDVFTFCNDWGRDTVEQTADGTVTLWFLSDSGTWDEQTLTYTAGASSVSVTGVTADRITLKFGGDGIAVNGLDFDDLLADGAFDGHSTRRIWEEEDDRGVIASL